MRTERILLRSALREPLSLKQSAKAYVNSVEVDEAHNLKSELVIPYKAWGKNWQAGDIKPLYVGYCLACAKRAHEAKQEQKAAVKPKPTFIIVWAALFTASLAGLVPMIGSGGTVDVATPGGVLSIVSVFLLIPALIGVIWSIATFVKKNRQYAAGAREPFKAPSEESMSSSAAYYMNKQPARFCEYLSIEQVKRMPRAMPF